MEENKISRVLYEAYRVRQSKVLPSWEHLTQDEQAGWVASGQAADAYYQAELADAHDARDAAYEQGKADALEEYTNPLPETLDELPAAADSER